MTSAPGAGQRPTTLTDHTIRAKETPVEAERRRRRGNNNDSLRTAQRALGNSEEVAPPLGLDPALTPLAPGRLMAVRDERGD